jgi:hypothetical protein
MPPRVDTRYQYARSFQDADGNWYLEVPRPFRFSNQPDNYPYTVKTGDTLFVLAYRFYRGFPNAPQLWRAIAEFNDIIDASAPLETGKKLIIPSMRWINEVFLAPPADYENILIQLGLGS